MTPFKTLIQAAFDGTGIDLTSGTFEMLFTDAAEGAPDDGDSGWEFEDDVTGAGGTITHRETITATFVNRVFDISDFTVNDPGGATDAKYVYVIQQGGGGASTNRLICHQDITDITWDGTNDEWKQHASGAFRIGGA